MARNISSFMLSVVIPTHNRAETIERAIWSVLVQGVENLEIIVVDDASTDATEQVVKALDDQRIRYIRHETNRGAPAARNTGIAAAGGDLIAFQDSDDEWMSDKLIKQLQLFEAGGDEVDVVYSGFQRQSHGTRIYIPGPRVACRHGNILQQLLWSNFVGTPTMVIRRKCFEKSGIFDERMPRYQDWELAIRLAKHYPFHLIDEPLVIAHETAGNISSDDANGVRGVKIILEKHRPLFEQQPVILASHLFNIGQYNCLKGKMAEGRLYFLKALKTRPQSVKTWIGLIASMFGPRVYSFALTVKRRIRPLPG